ncbi:MULTISPECIES: hypothetical protein [Bacillaceae]|uniref:Uncharacterized protein n=1 Tax=Evansella alkalicola TaxID=745819 RepID=A0ABS6K2E8_9BACI|nr:MULTISPECIES: hypothetical protein [Bacillaceae]MBU9723990.1 hypothetical protein [Bacillus alkalicola]
MSVQSPLDNERKNIEENEKIYSGQYDDWDDELDVYSLPPRSEVHHSGKLKKDTSSEISRSKAKQKKQEKQEKQFPLVKVLLVLFISLVTIMITYPIWSDMLF